MELVELHLGHEIAESHFALNDAMYGYLKIRPSLAEEPFYRIEKIVFARTCNEDGRVSPTALT